MKFDKPDQKPVPPIMVVVWAMQGLLILLTAFLIVTFSAFVVRFHRLPVGGGEVLNWVAGFP
jgi:hypothetical protein